ncbi:hypothetical protein BG74_08490 [Sodalis-like endosymbiont of Proechinophthirus fluctus]|nr:cation:proton antiporter [Sodalis-like endosymbiont of Proechinophthirus fluctus]KYP95643.1 hypothetical protein BG74_08490 [Sodalis-like endosymbiont of Proechinophthirus fluctus]
MPVYRQYRVVLLRALEERQLIDSRRGQIAIGWLIVEDLVMVLTLVLLQALGDIPRHTRYRRRSTLARAGIALTIAVSLAAQLGELTLILLEIALNMLFEQRHHLLVLVGMILSIMINPLMLAMLEPI